MRLVVTNLPYAGFEFHWNPFNYTNNFMRPTKPVILAQVRIQCVNRAAGANLMLRIRLQPGFRPASE